MQSQAKSIFENREREHINVGIVKNHNNKSINSGGTNSSGSTIIKIKNLYNSHSNWNTGKCVVDIYIENLFEFQPSQTYIYQQKRKTNLLSSRWLVGYFYFLHTETISMPYDNKLLKRFRGGWVEAPQEIMEYRIIYVAWARLFIRSPPLPTIIVIIYDRVR